MKVAEGSLTWRLTYEVEKPSVGGFLKWLVRESWRSRPPKMPTLPAHESEERLVSGQ
jgi:hypothetical protein